jgi:hypothetical protein
VPPRVIAPLALALAATAGALSALPLAEAGAATIKACAAKQGGAVRVLKAGGSCTGAENPLSWNNPGPAGPQGTAGAQGPAGPQGPPGASGFQTSSGVTGLIPAGNVGAIDVPCPDGETAISGGYVVPYTATVLESHPRPDNAGTWTVTAAFPSVSGTISAYAQCAQVTAAAARSVKVTAVTRTTRLSPLARPPSGR